MLIIVGDLLRQLILRTNLAWYIDMLGDASSTWIFRPTEYFFLFKFLLFHVWLFFLIIEKVRYFSDVSSQAMKYFPCLKSFDIFSTVSSRLWNILHIWKGSIFFSNLLNFSKISSLEDHWTILCSFKISYI